ncbi:hypothetical protein [Agromyces aureus]|uniref:Uncharacterized protein n=1 Tax=Agromyces aureus TaxID=453304 RepID=A0A191WH22_9MICO|nr:hypothetical protein [Agromyces aureus]ANJ27473.1 hypothetical protein ATC03_12895 [Agromyces aureus]
MTTATLSPGSGAIAALAVRSGLGIAEWGLRRAARRNDRARLVARLEARAIAASALAERDAMIRSSVQQLY